MSKLDYNSLFGDSKIDIECPHCKKPFSVKMSQIGSSVKCAKCSSKINLEKDSSYNKDVAKVNKSLSELEKTLKKFGK